MTRRRVMQIVVLLLLLGSGAIVNVAVAWGCAMRDVRNLEHDEILMRLNHTTRHQTTIHRDFGELWLSQNLVGVGWWNHGPLFDRIDDGQYRTLVPVGSYFHDTEPIERFRLQMGNGTLRIRFEERLTGRPCLSLRAHQVVRSSSASAEVVEASGIMVARPAVKNVLNSTATGIAGAQLPREIHALPLCPIWPGFAINTIFYAAILWMVWFVPGQLRRTLRRRRGQCPACAYPIATSEVCTECGGPTANVKTSTRQNVKRVESSESA